ncbi:hypothetical protein [Caballeronia sp. LZ035]|uniref:hypothetical protein n=1 Tax=Caballeronia sp. LZ035 TaxID=3038568 RepID=UPI00285F5C06|nr:hypothetical protein [Caballeronia sp. LZ035]MDR5756658.1 hypothetical protein [Caballeronia sp. LZ035]
MMIEEETERFDEDWRNVKEETAELFVKLRDDPKLAVNIMPMLTLEWTGQGLKAFAENGLIANSTIAFGADASMFFAENLKSNRY